VIQTLPGYEADRAFYVICGEDPDNHIFYPYQPVTYLVLNDRHKCVPKGDALDKPVGDLTQIKETMWYGKV